MLLDHKKYKNILDQIDLSTANIESQIIDYHLIFDKYEDPVVEWQMSIPMFVPSFYKHVVQEGRIPKQLDLWSTYCSQNGITESDPMYRGMKARYLRAYPSLVRDIHFCTLLKEKSKGAEVIYNAELDIIEGVDILLIFKEKYYSLNLFTNTKRALEAREKKVKRHSKYTNVTQIDIPVAFEDAKKCGDFYLYGDNEINALRSFFVKQNE